MKRQHIYIIGLISVLGFWACSKERNPRLTIHVQEEDGLAVVGASVRAWHGGNPPNSGSGNPDTTGMDQTGITNGSGNVSFDFKYSAVLDVDVTYSKAAGVDSLQNPVTEILEGSKVVVVETKRQRSKDNEFNETVTVK